MSNQEEPLRNLTHEEFELLRASIRGSKKTHNQTRVQVNANKIASAEFAIGEEGLEIGLKVWQMRKAGWTRGEIREELGISMTVLDSCLREYELRVGMEAGRMMEHYRCLDDERIEGMLRTWLPIACEGKVRIQKIREGQIFSELDFDRPLKAGFFVLQAINMRLRLMMAGRPEGAKESQTSVLVWLQNVMPGVAKVVENVEAAPREILSMESEAENAAR